MSIKDLLDKYDLSDEAIEESLQRRYKEHNENPENMSYWLPKIMKNFSGNKTVLLVPETKVVKLGFDYWKWLRSDRYSDGDLKEFGEFLKEEIRDFLPRQKLFMKTGVFSNKFEFRMTGIRDRDNLGDKFKDMYYVSMLLGADNTDEVVFREYIEDIEDRKKIYEGMPLHTEFRVFYDFDTHEVLGVSNYWHPDIMRGFGSLREDDLESYNKEKERLEKEFGELKSYVSEEVKKLMSSCVELSGSWSVDVMKNGDEFWLIDMARKSRSALVSQMEEVDI